MRFFFLFFLSFSLFVTGQERVVFSPTGGVYPSIKELKITIPNGFHVYYTTDGSAPNKTDKEVTQPINITGNKAFLFAVYAPQAKQAKIVSHTYITEKKELPIISLQTDSHYLFDSLTGIYEKGCCAEKKPPYKGANFWKDIEVPVHVEMIESTNKQVINQPAGIKIFGGYSVSMPQKSFAVYARKKYGDNRFRTPLFPQLPFKKYKNFILRNAGDDMKGAHIRDALTSQLIKNKGVLFQEYRPVIVYINGNYWGIYNLREKINEHFIEAHTDWKKEELAIIRQDNKLQHGPKSGLIDFKKAMKSIKNLDATNDSSQAYLQQTIAIDEYLKYNITQVFIGNTDASSNIRWTKELKPTGKWRPILFDLDMGWGIFGKDEFLENSLALFTSDSDTNKFYPTQSTFLIRKILQNDVLRYQYITTFFDALNTRFKSTNMDSTLTSLLIATQHEMKDHRKRWNISSLRYKRSLNRLHNFIKNRPSTMRRQLYDFFELKDSTTIHVVVPKGGKVVFNSLCLTTNFTGSYPQNIPIKFRAVPDEYHQFIGWKKNGFLRQQVRVLKQDLIQLEPIFKRKKTAEFKDKVLLTEMNVSQPKGSKYDDWIELYNASDKNIDLSNWTLKDAHNNHEFVVPKGTVLAANGYLIMTENGKEWKKKYGDTIPVIGNIPFGFKASTDKIRMYDTKKLLVIDVDLAALKAVKNESHSWLLTEDKTYKESASTPGESTVSELKKPDSHNTTTFLTTLLFLVGIGAAMICSIIILTNLAKKLANKAKS